MPQAVRTRSAPPATTRWRKHLAGFDLRSWALLFSTAGAVPLPILGLIEPGLVVPGGMPWIMAVWCYTLLSVAVVLIRKPINEREFILLSSGGIVGIAACAFLLADPVNAYVILCLQASVPAMAAMSSRMRVVAAFQLVALSTITTYGIHNGIASFSLLLRLGAGAMAVGFPTLMVLGLRLTLEKSLRAQRKMSRTDPLTGLLNRRGLIVEGDGLLAAARTQGRGVGILALDIDNFKGVNDRHGHSFGDTVLVRTADLLAAHTAPHHGVAARLGGEEFVVLVIADRPDVVAAVAEKIRLAVAEAGTVTISVGAVYVADLTFSSPTVATEPVPPGTDPGRAAIIDDLVSSADENLYQAKQAGRNRVLVSHRALAA